MAEDDPGDESALTTDPTLGGADAEGDFPDTAAGTRLVLYQAEDGAVDLRWQIDPGAIAHARAAFAGSDARPVLRLHHVGPQGADRLMADADLDDDAAAEGGLAHYAGADAEGLLQAEIGLATAEGGWLLIARSNGLSAAVPVGAAFLRGAPEAPAAADLAAATDFGGAFGAPDALGASFDESPKPLPLEPNFPFVEPVLSGTEGIIAAVLSGGEAAGVVGAAGLVSAAAAENGIEPSLADVAADEGALRAERKPPEPPPGGVVPRLERARPSPSEPDGAGSPPAQPGSSNAAPMSGSGPISPVAADATLRAELLVHGSAPPNTLLDLGGHPYRVGPGGRFALRIPITDRELILRVLAALPQLPVADRDEQ